jgi:hypothetical protein
MELVVVLVLPVELVALEVVRDELEHMQPNKLYIKRLI